MADRMEIPATFDEFAEQYKIVDKKEVYTNGTELIPVFRVKQWLEANAMTKEDVTCPMCYGTGRCDKKLKSLEERIFDAVITRILSYSTPILDYENKPIIKLDTDIYESLEELRKYFKGD